MAIIDSLNNLQNNIASAKQTLATNISSKGVTTITTANTLTEMAVAVSTIEQSGGGTPAVLEELSVTENGSYTPKEGVDGYSKVTVNVEGASGGNYLISPQDLAKEYSNPTLPWQMDSNSQYTLLKPTLPCLTEEEYLTHHYDSDNYSEVANVDSNGNQIYTKWAGEMPEFNDYMARGYVLKSNGVELDNYDEYVSYIRQFQITTKDGEVKNIDVCGDSFDICSKGSTYQESFTNPVDGTSFYHVYPMVKSNGYYKNYRLGSGILDINVIGANLMLQGSQYNSYMVTEENENTLIFDSKNIYNKIRGEYFNFFFNDKQYKNLKCIAGQRFPFKKGIKVIDNTTLTSTFIDNPNSEPFKDCEIEKVDFSNINGSEKITTMSYWFNNCKKLKSITFGENWNTPNLTDLYGCFSDCVNLSVINNLDKFNTSSVTSLSNCFSNCSSLTDLSSIANWNTSSVTSLSNCFSGCSSLTKIPPINLDGVTDTNGLFSGCKELNKIILQGDPSSITSMDSMFGWDRFHKLQENGTLTYDHRYDYSKIIEELHKYNPTWTAKPSYEPQECLSLSITADDCVGNQAITTIHYTAMTNGINTITQERVEGVEVKGDAVSEPFGENPSYDTSRQVTVNYTYMGQTATTTITQGVKIHPSATVDLMGNWELAPNETIPNLDSSLYDGVYQSVHKGQGNVKDKMIITFVAMPNFELYIRSNGEAYYDFVYCGKIDQAEPTENDNQASTKGNQQSGTDLASYTKVEYPNDGGQHTITVVYSKDSSGDSGDDRGYVFFKKPQ